MVRLELWFAALGVHRADVTGKTADYQIAGLPRSASAAGLQMNQVGPLEHVSAPRQDSFPGAVFMESQLASTVGALIDLKTNPGFLLFGWLASTCARSALSWRPRPFQKSPAGDHWW
jgi:hypothetical protein